MRGAWLCLAILAASVSSAACAGPSAAAAHATEPDLDDGDHAGPAAHPAAHPTPAADAADSGPPLDEGATRVVTSSHDSHPISTATYEQATASPEPLDLHDDRRQLTDAELSAPMRGVSSRCRIPANARITIRTAVRNGHAIGVTVEVELSAPKAKPGARSRYAASIAAKREAKVKAEISTCVDRTVRALSWPPTLRRDAFTTVF